VARRAQRYPDDLPGSAGVAKPAYDHREIIAEPLRTYHPKMPRQEVRDRVKAMMMKVGCCRT
jgi:hypothetical protein